MRHKTSTEYRYTLCIILSMRNCQIGFIYNTTTLYSVLFYYLCAPFFTVLLLRFSYRPVVSLCDTRETVFIVYSVCIIHLVCSEYKVSCKEILQLSHVAEDNRTYTTLFLLYATSYTIQNIFQATTFSYMTETNLHAYNSNHNLTLLGY